MQKIVQSDKLVSALEINKILTFVESLKKVFYFRREKSRISQSTRIKKLISGEKWRKHSEELRHFGKEIFTRELFISTFLIY